MKKLLLATTCLALTSTVSMAADMGMPYTKAPMATSAFSWTGCYAGAHVGGGNLTTSGINALNSEGLFGNQNANGSGAVAGGQLGCNYQDGNWVFGLEGEGYWSNIKSNQTFVNTNPDTFGFRLQNNSDFTIAARVGMTFDRTLIYGKGGWAFGNYKATGFEHESGGFSQDETAKGTLNGFLVGAGIEHALTHNWTVKAEYDFIGYGAKSLSSTLCTDNVCAPNGSAPISSNKQIVKVGFNYLFGGFGH